MVPTGDPDAMLTSMLEAMPETPATVIIAVGDEILSGHTQDTNSAFLAARAFAAGFPVRRIEVVADRLEDVVTAVHRALSDGAVTRIAVCGGIGPTPDDRTFEAVARALGRVAHRFELTGDVDHRLRRDAAADQTGAAEFVGFDDHCVEAELAGADRGDLTARPAADD